ncbi:MAG: malectin domain-containing carbohydrate-binding protein [Candidatus Solibacter sp.]|nr:malectin domain-containing carbohydrate-binding protein [Candidatus Solibacter sp.]
MHAAADFRQEKHELDAVLASGILNRAPNLAQVLRYVCAKYFEGAAGQIKEYNIAVDALGRPADFDQKRDSIVRVEAHRLRKRLREYYEADGADHAIRIDIPPGQYAPRFLPSGAPIASLSTETLVGQDDIGPESFIPAKRDPDSQAAPLVPSPVEPAIPAVAGGVGYRRRNAAIVTVLLLIVGATAGALWRTPDRSGAKSAVIPPPIFAAVANPLEVRILAGHQGGDYTDRLGRIWQSDRYFQGGSVFESHDHPIFGTGEPGIYQSRREGPFLYDIPLPAGVYELRLHFAETLYGENNVAGGGESSRVFNVWINGKEALHEFDVIGEVGPSTADVRAFKDIAPAADGKLHLKFEPFSNPPLLSAIEIVPGTPGKLRPIRMFSLDSIYVDKQGRVWEPARYARGGQPIRRTKPVESAADPELFRGERFGNLRYAIPVPPGRYGVTFYLAEAWFGPDTPAGGGVGSRVFDILCNGVALRRGFDVFKEARGGGRGVTWTAHGLEPDAQGKLSISLAPVRNYACVNAVEVLDESK